MKEVSPVYRRRESTEKETEMLCFRESTQQHEPASSHQVGGNIFGDGNEGGGGRGGGIDGDFTKLSTCVDLKKLL